MGKKIKILSLLLLILGNIHVSAQAYLVNLNKQANEMIAAQKKGDYKTLLSYTHPKVVNALGGNEKAVASLKADMKAFEKQKINIIKAQIGSATQSLVSGKTIQCILPQTVEMQIGEKKARSKTYLFGISYDNGKKWYFLDTAPLKATGIRKLIPETSKDIIIPKPEFTYN